MDVAAIVCIGWLFSVCLHEFGHAIVAYAGGDHSVKDKGYLTFNIFKYTDPQVSLLFPIIILMLGGIALPGAAVYIDRSRLRSRFWASLVSAAGPAASAATAGLFSLPFILDWHFQPHWRAGIAFLVLLQIVSVLLNLIPVPGLDGFGIIEPWLPVSARIATRKVAPYAFWLIIAAIWFVPGVNELLWDFSYMLTAMLGVPPRAVALGAQFFSKQSGWLVVALIVVLFLVRKRGAGRASATAPPPPAQSASAGGTDS